MCHHPLLLSQLLVHMLLLIWVLSIRDPTIPLNMVVDIVVILREKKVSLSRMEVQRERTRKLPSKAVVLTLPDIPYGKPVRVSHVAISAGLCP